MTGSHTKMSPSSFARRIACPGSWAAEAPLPDKDSPFAAEGTAAHELCEWALISGNSLEERLGDTIDVKMSDGTTLSFEVDREMIDHCSVYVDHCNEYRGGDVFEVETKLNLPFLGEGEKGTADLIALRDKVLHVKDLKYGKGVAVEAVENVQALCYGMGAAQRFDNYDWDTLRVTIVQPRAPHADGPIRSWDISRDDLIDYLFEFSAAAEAARAPDAPRISGEHCRFCKAAPTCPALRDDVLSTAEETFAVANYDGDAIADALDRIPVVKGWIKAVEDKAMADARAGHTPPRYKMVATRATRKWKDETVARATLWTYGLEDGDVYDRSFKSPAKIEEIVGKKAFQADLAADLVESVSAGVTLAPIDDPRPPIRSDAESTFSNVE